MKTAVLKQVRHARRIVRVRKKMTGTAERPRLAISRSNKNIGVQLIDDVTGRTLLAISSQSKDLRSQCGYGGNKQAATIVGKAVGEKAKSLGIEHVCFDRRGYRYHGRIKALADAAREAGLKF